MRKQFIILSAIISLIVCLMVSGCGALSGYISDDTADKNKTVGIIAALDCEMDILKDSLENMQTEEFAGAKYYTGTIANHEVICMKCGMGKVSAALGAQAMITYYQPDVIINTGSAGALSSELNVGDVVLAEYTVEWDLDATELGDPRGYISSMDKIKMTADKETVDEMAELIGSAANVYRGLIATGDQFVSTYEQRKTILDEFPDALCAEMEGGAIGHVCEQNGVPFCVIRCISDNANGDSDVDFAAFSELAGEKSAEILLDYLNTY